VRAKPYARYRQSGIPWFGELPAHWQVIALKWISTRYAGGTPDRNNEAYWDEGTIPWINSGAVNQGLITEPSAYITEEGYKNSSAKWVPERALVMALAGQGRTKGMVAQTAIRTTCNQSMAAIVPKRNTDLRFLYWSLTMQYEQIRNMAGGEQRDGLNLDILGLIPCIDAPRDEQRAIAEFLDRETTVIDTLVARKRSLIERMEEKRVALISRTVNRGLPPEAARAAGLATHPELKDSGIDWFGDVPAHWEIKQLKWAVMFQRGHDLPSDDREEGDVPLVSSSGVSATHSRAIARGPGIVTGRYGTIGQFYLIREDYWPLNTTLYSIDLRGNEPRYLQALLAHLAPLFLLNAVKSAVPGVDRNDIHPIAAAVPPIAEQKAMADFLEREMANIDTMTRRIQVAIDRLQEYRRALITAAVTGKIDVRGESADNRLELASVP
jgi:type I restriction enzyme S subunit